MADYSILFMCVLIVSLKSSLANQYFENPGTAIIEAVPADNTVSNNERGDMDLTKDSSEKCTESEISTPDNLSPELISLNHLNTPNPDPYLRARYHKGHYYPYSSYNMYEVDSLNDSGPRGRGVNYNEVWYPYTNPNIYTSAPYSNIPPVRSLPPVYARLYGNSLPIEEEWIPSLIRRQRKLHEDDDLLKQLEYDAIMKNIMPTMPIPFPRDASTQSNRIPYSYASFPPGSSGCALPILLGCTPTIRYGKLEYQNAIPFPYAHEYRNLLENNKVHDHVDISDGKVANIH